MVAHRQLLVADVASEVGHGHDSQTLADLPVDTSEDQVNYSARESLRKALWDCQSICVPPLVNVKMHEGNGCVTNWIYNKIGV